MKVKVCGIKYSNNLSRLAQLDLAMIGFNFHPQSKRYVHTIGDLDLAKIPASVKRIGVFVKASRTILKQRTEEFGLDYLQLHGDETVSEAEEAQALCAIIKVFRIDAAFDFSLTKNYDFADLFLFDTYTKDYGGSGKRFDWQQLNNYKGETPFLLAGGIGPSDVAKIKMIKHPQFYGVDINSGFELEPGLKDEDSVSTFIQQLKSNS